MNVSQAIRSRRSIRRFLPRSLPEGALRELTDGALCAPSASGLRPLRFLAANDPALRRKIFPALRWAGAGQPPPGHRPAAYIVVLVDSAVRETGWQWEAGAAVQSILLAAWEKGIGSCWILSLDRARLGKALRIPARYLIDSVVALGYPAAEPPKRRLRLRLRAEG